MLYTVGDPEIYDPIISRNGKLIKTGKRENYLGGSIFTSISEANDVKGIYDIYYVDTDVNNTYVYNDKRYLIKDADIISKHKYD